MKNVISGALALAALAALVAFLFDRGVLRFNNPSLSEFPVQGVDVSHHQGPIAWPELKAPEISFVYIKASEGEKLRDPKFAENWTGASSVDLVPGAYHFYSLCAGGAAQARNFLAALSKVKGRGLPPAVDLELGGNCRDRPSPESFLRELAVFLAAVRERFHCEPVLYVTKEFFEAYLASGSRSSPLWVRDVFGRPGPEFGAWKFWQFANRGRKFGVRGFVDLDVYLGRWEEFGKELCELGESVQAPSSGREGTKEKSATEKSATEVSEE